ncbi:MAG TPA: hypothetical protein VGB63_02550, partial [Pedobacter sp.]
CKKEKVEENNNIYRKWIIVDEYYGYLNGGNFRWNPVPSNHFYPFIYILNLIRIKPIKGQNLDLLVNV